MSTKTKQTIAYFLTTAFFVLFLEYVNDTMTEGGEDPLGFFLGNFVFTYAYGFLMIVIYNYGESKTFRP